MRGGGSSTGRHRTDQQPASHRTGRLLTVQPALSPRWAPGPTAIVVRIEFGSVQPVRVLPNTPFDVGVGWEVGWAGQPQDAQIVGVVQVVEFRCPQDLRLGVEGGVVAEVQFIEVADFPELIEGDNVRDLVAIEICPAVSRTPEGSCSVRPGETVLGQPECPSGRNGRNRGGVMA
jgi:hypothetical protein